MRTPSDRDESICAMFDSFCVTVIRNYSRNLKRAAENRKKYDATGDEAVEYLIELLAHEDVYNGRYPHSQRQPGSLPMQEYPRVKMPCSIRCPPRSAITAV